MTLDPVARRSPRGVAEPLAIIGIGCRFPGAAGPDALWRLLRDGVDAITEVPADRFDINAVYDPRPRIPGKLNSRWGGFLKGIDQFDPYFFGISPREATGMDPQHRLLLEVAWEALEDAGQVPERLDGSRAGVFVGMCTNDYERLIEPADIDIYVTAGNARSVIAGRLSYALGLEGPSVVVDTACSSSLVAVHLACRSLWSGECGFALAGGVNLILLPEPSLGFSQAQMLAPDGRCKAFDARGDGFVRSEGAGVVALKPLRQALADNDPVYAVVRGSAVNNDGRSGGLLMTPSRPGQEAVLREAYRIAGVSPGQVHYVETHGTGTSVGDPIEAAALGAVLAVDRPKDRPCRIGSVKTNIGHTEGAAGIAGLIKVALCLKHRAIPPSLHFREANPRIPWEDLPLEVQQKLEPWPTDARPALAGVSSFGIPGTNAHVVLEEAPETIRVPEGGTPVSPRAELLPISAHTRESLEVLARTYQACATAEDEQAPALREVCYTASVRRAHHDHRLAVVVRSREELTEHLEAFLQGELRAGMSAGRRMPDGRPRLVFVFPGQGSQWVGMARALLEQETVFRDAIERCDRAMQPYVDWSLPDELTADESHARLHQLDVVQPALCAVQIALVALWRSWGVEPDAVVGHSMGEMAAAHVAGILRLDDAARIVCRRGRLLKERLSGRGGMAVVELPAEAVERLLRGYDGRLAVAARNGPTTTVVSGDLAALRDLGETAHRQGTFFQTVKIDYAPHSPQTEPVLDDVLEALRGIQPRPASVPMISTVSAALLDGTRCDASYWVRNLREPILFAQATDHLVQEGYDTFLEISAHPVLTSAIAQCLRQRGRDGAVLPTLRREEDGRAVMLGSLGTLYTHGYPVDWTRLYPTGGRCVRLPAYPWQRERFWLEGPPSSRVPGRAPSVGARDGNGPGLLGHQVELAVQPGMTFWEMDLGPRFFPYLGDHRIRGLIVLPAAAFVEIALAAAAAAFGPNPPALEEVSFRQALPLPEDATQRVQLVLSPRTADAVAFQFLSLQAGAPPEPASWTLHADGTIRLGQAGRGTSPLEHESPAPIRARCVEIIQGAEFYQTMRDRGLEFGQSFQGVEQVWRRDGEAIGRLHLPATVESEAGAYHVHPALLDAAFQVMAGAFPKDDARGTGGGLFLPVGIERVRVHARPGASLWSHGVLRPGAGPDGDALAGDVLLLDENGQVMVEVRGLRFRRLEHDARRAIRPDFHDWLYEVRWQPKPRPQPARDPGLPPFGQEGGWLIFTDRGGVGAALRELLEARGERCVVVSPGEAFEGVAPGHYRVNPSRPADFRQLLVDALRPAEAPCRGVIHLWGLDTASPSRTALATLEAAQDLGCLSVLHLVQGLAQARRTVTPRLWIVTGGAQAVGTESEPVWVAQSPLWGLGRVISVEHPEVQCTKVDLSPRRTPEEIQGLFHELWSGDREDQIALRGSARYVARVVRCSPEAAEERTRVAVGDEPFRLEVKTPGILDDFTLRATTRRKPGPGEVEIRVCTVGLNFRDVLIAMGLVPPVIEGSQEFGFECAGRIVALGDGVEGLQVGAEVVAPAPACFGAFVTTPAALAVPKPAHLSFEEAATIPIAFLTAYYALHHLGRLRRGERVLIHAAAGGVGQAAVQLAQRVGAEVFATAGSPEKREFLKAQGVPHVMDSRSLDFADEILRLTDGTGVDVVLNSLAGEFIPKSLSTLRPGGRFLEIGKVDVLRNAQLGLRQLQNNLSLFVIDLGQLFVSSPDFFGSLFRELMQHFSDAGLKPLPLQAFPISEAASAFRHMAQAKHIGKVVVSLEQDEVSIAPARGGWADLRSDRTYLITGGLGGLGLAIAERMVQQGARHLALMGRRGVASDDAKDALARMRLAGAQVVVAGADVAVAPQVAGVLREIGESMPPLGGVIHAAAVMDDSILLQLDRERFERVMAPKVYGGWNLHALTLNTPLDFFVLFSSAASLLGSPGLGNYVAANAFLDGLAHHRRALGLPALTINWGAWADVGLAARPDRTRHLGRQGIRLFTPEQGVELMERLLRRDSPQIMAISVDWAKLLDAYSSPFLEELAAEARQPSPSAEARRTKDGLTPGKLLAADPNDRRPMLEAFLRDHVAKVLRCSASKLDVHQPLNRLGIDSLMAVELKNRLEADLGVTLPVALLLKGPSLAQMAATLLDQLTTARSTPSAPPLTGREDADRLLAKADQLSAAEVDALLRDMTAAEAGRVVREAQSPRRSSG